MGNVFRVLWRDIVRLLRTPAATIVVMFLVVLPSIYTWYNVIGFWDPYNNTGNMRVCVVNMDDGGSSELTGDLNVGDSILDALKENDQLDWEITDFNDAMDQLASGQSYAVFIIPHEFTSDLLTITTGNFTQPNIHYYVNEKTGPVAPKITDTGSTTLDETINSTFVSTVSDVIAKSADGALADASAQLSDAHSEATRRIDNAVNTLSAARSNLADVQTKLENAHSDVSGARSGLDQASEDITSASDTLSAVSNLTDEMRTDLDKTAAAATPLIGNVSSQLAQAYSQAQKASTAVSKAAGEAEATVDYAVAEAQQVVDSTSETIAELEEIRDALPEGSATRNQMDALIKELTELNNGAQKTLDDLPQLETDAKNLTDTANSALKSMDSTINAASNAFSLYSSQLFGTTFPTVSRSLGQLTATSSDLSAAIKGQQLLIGQTNSVLDQLDDTVSVSQTALSQTDDILAGISDEMDTVRTDLVALQEASAYLNSGKVDTSKFADFMGSPAQLVTEELYPITSYGAAMGPLFMNLTCWIGAFMLLVIMRQEVDDEGIKNLTLTQRYLGRFSLFCMLVTLQAVVCCIGLLILGVQPVNAPAMFIAMIVASLAYLSIIYMLSVTLQHIGKGLCILLVFIQIPGATGLYPIEMTSPFFQTIYPFMPFTYGINSMREAICGFYGNQYVSDLLVLVLFFVVFLLLGVLLRPLLANVNRMTADQVEESGILNGETVDIPARQFRISQVFRALSDKEEYRRNLVERYERFVKRRPLILRFIIIIGVAVPIVFTVVFSLGTTAKVTLLTFWLLWLVFVFLALIIVENVRFSLNRQLNLNDMTNDEMIKAGHESGTERGPHDA